VQLSKDLPVGTLIWELPNGTACSPICSGHLIIIVGRSSPTTGEDLVHLWLLEDGDYAHFVPVKNDGEYVTRTMTEDEFERWMNWNKVISLNDILPAMLKI
jgi:hypothetical protein